MLNKREKFQSKIDELNQFFTHFGKLCVIDGVIIESYANPYKGKDEDAKWGYDGLWDRIKPDPGLIDCATH